jgi:chorismate synthase
MSGNTFGKLFCVTSFGESHGPAIGCVVDGCPPGLSLDAADIQRELDRRKPGTSRHVTQRRESDTVEILSGVFEGHTTGTPIGRVTPITPTCKNTASATIAAVAGNRRVRPQSGSLPGRLPASGCASDSWSRSAVI